MGRGSGPCASSSPCPRVTVPATMTVEWRYRMQQSIVCGVEASQASRSAANVAAALAGRLGHNRSLVHVAAAPRPSRPRRPPSRVPTAVCDSARAPTAGVRCLRAPGRRAGNDRPVGLSGLHAHSLESLARCRPIGPWLTPARPSGNFVARRRFGAPGAGRQLPCGDRAPARRGRTVPCAPIRGPNHRVRGRRLARVGRRPDGRRRPGRPDGSSPAADIHR